MNDDKILIIVGLSLIALVVSLFLIRWAVRANENIRNQRIIIFLMLQQWKQNGVSQEEIEKFRKQFDQDWLANPEHEYIEAFNKKDQSP